MVEQVDRLKQQRRGYWLVVGAGLSGASMVRHLLSQKERVVWVDSRLEPPLESGSAELLVRCAGYRFGRFVTTDFMAARAIAVSPGVAADMSLLQQARRHGIEVVGDIELFARAVKAPVVAITGSNGKSTVTALLGEMIAATGVKVAVGGNLGTPALDLLDKGKELYLLELSSFQLELTESLALEVALLLNLTADHLDRHGSLERYGQLKQRIFHHARQIVWQSDEPTVAALAEPWLPKAAREWRYSLQPPSGPQQLGVARGADEQLWIVTKSERLMPLAELKLSGGHNRVNLLAAWSVIEALGLDRAAARAAAARFSGLPHRCQWVASLNGVSWFNDSKGTNVGATVAALAGFEQPVVLIAGGVGKGADFSPLRQAVARSTRAVVLLGIDSPAIAAAVEGVVPVVRVASMAEAVAEAARLASPGDAVLLSPACASFDMFSHYIARGEAFTAAVKMLQRAA
ncbi:UDP-N-acetylmuramoyl-L-alanine--D-glutamate ligase [Ectothiorhodospiraceae bacterium BW-2]|nr:UDP-N-acetylmuramoyl-L-alanine--D-glutamate ligase [Ectothiorhodospiraceae bacterium BW-2]